MPELNAWEIVKEETTRRIRKEMEDMTPLERLEHVALAQKHERRRMPSYDGVFATHNPMNDSPGERYSDYSDLVYMAGEGEGAAWWYPLSRKFVTEVQQEATRYIQDFANDAESLSQRLKHLDDILLELGLMDDFDGIVEDVRVKARRLREYVASRLEAERESRREHATPSGEAVDDESEPGTLARWQHLARAVVILERRPDLKKKRDFNDAALKMKDGLGMSNSEDPGPTTWKGVQRLAKDVLKVRYLPDRYKDAEGFRRLVYDLTAGTASAHPKERQQDS